MRFISSSEFSTFLTASHERNVPYSCVEKEIITLHVALLFTFQRGCFSQTRQIYDQFDITVV